MKAKRLYILLLLLLTTLAVSAQKDFFLFKAARAVKNYVDSSVIKTADSSYIVVPKKPWQLIVRHKIDRMGLKMHSVIDTDEEYMNWTPYVGTRAANSLGLWFGYRGYGLGYSVNLNKRSDTYFTIGAVGSSYGINLRLRTFGMTEFNGDIYLKTKNPDQELLNGNYDFEILEPIRVHSLIIDGYYMFNHKHFSYAAAYDQSVFQKRSAGSLMAGLMYNYTHIDYASDLNGDIIYMMDGLGRVKLWQGSVGVGYAYNWVPVRGLLVNVMAMPMLTFVNKLKAYAYATNVEELMEDPYFWDPDVSDEEWDKWFYDSLRIKPLGDQTYNSGISIGFDARLSVTYNLGRYFINAYGQFNNIRYHHNSTHGYLNDWFINASIGIRL